MVRPNANVCPSDGDQGPQGLFLQLRPMNPASLLCPTPGPTQLCTNVRKVPQEEPPH